MGAEKCWSCGRKTKSSAYDKEAGNWKFVDTDGDKITVERPYTDYPDGHVLIGAIKGEDERYAYVRLTCDQVLDLARVLKKCAALATQEGTD